MDENTSKEGFISIEEHAREYMDLFLLLQQEKSAATLFLERKMQLEEREGMTEIFLPAVCLRERYGLMETEYWVVMFAFCCELEGGLCLDYRNKYRKDTPDLQYALHLLSPVLSVTFADVAEFSHREGPAEEILDWRREEEAEAGRERRGILQRPMLLKRVIFQFLLTGRLPREEWYELAGAGEEEEAASGGMLPFLHERECDKLCSHLGREKQRRILLFGRRGSGSHTLVRRVCKRAGVNGLFIRAEYLFRGSASQKLGIRHTLCFILRLFHPVMVMELAEDISGLSGREERERVWKRLETCGCRSVCFLAQTREQAGLIKDYADVRISLAETLTREEKRRALDLWIPPQERRSWQEDLLAFCHLNIGELKRRQQAVILQAQAGGYTLADREIWQEALRDGQEALPFGKIVTGSCGPEDMILPRDCRRQLDTVVRLAKAWRGEKGLQLLFHGSSGTGKTMAASMLAGQLHLPLFKVDLSQVFDKYIGETEKHIEEIFRIAERNHFLLFFDEADSLFARRTAVRDAHDRYANVSASFLLQRMEEYDGVLILATNLKDHFDDAFVRRIRFAVKFRNLDREGRERLWEKELRGKLPLDGDVNPGILAEAAQLSPARIAAAAHVAKLLAAWDGCGAVTAGHIREALTLEASKDETAIKRFYHEEKV